MKASEAGHFLEVMQLTRPFKDTCRAESAGSRWRIVDGGHALWWVDDHEKVGAKLARPRCDCCGELTLSVPPRHMDRWLPPYPWSYSPGWAVGNVVDAHEAILRRICALHREMPLRAALFCEEARGRPLRDDDRGIMIYRDVAAAAGWRAESVGDGSRHVRVSFDIDLAM